MKYPYGISDFNALISEGYYYCDRTDRIAMLEDMGKYLLFIRPRRFGKSLLLSMLKNYYDAAKKDRFDILFSHLKIGKNPTNLHNKYLIFQLDFSCVDPAGTIENIKQALYDHINSCIKSFLIYYRNYTKVPVEIDKENAVSSLESLFSCI